jgi:molybdate transport system substrate-binding protein
MTWNAGLRTLATGIVLLILLVVAAACGNAAEITSTAPPTGASTVTSTAEPTTEASATSTTSSAATSGEPQELTVSAAAGLKAAFTKIGELFDQKNNVKTTFNFAAAGVLQSQIEGGASVDVFASADPKNMNTLVDEGLADASSVKTIAGNEIVLIVPANSTLGIASFEDLANPDVKKVATGNPDSTPLGVATLKILPALDIEASVKPKLIYSETVSQTLEYVAQGEVDAGIVWSSEAQTGGTKIKVVAIADHSWYGEAKFVIGTITNSKNKE